MRDAGTRGWQARAGGKAICHQRASGQGDGANCTAKGPFSHGGYVAPVSPAFDSIRQIVSEGILGEITSVVADLGEYFRPDPAYRLFSPDLAGVPC